MPGKLSNFLVAAYLYKTKKLERKIGFRVRFNYIPKDFIQGLMVFDMSKVWKNYGLNAKGVNCFTFGEINNDVSSRYDKASRQYQSWLGCYLVQFSKKQEFTIQDHINLANSDQLNWLKIFGDENPLCKLEENNFQTNERISIDSFSGELYEGGGFSHSDVGMNYDSIKFKLLMNLLSLSMNFLNKNLNLSQRNLIPQTNGNYEKIFLKGYVAIVKLEDNVKLVVYGNGTEKTWPLLKNEIYDAFKSIQIQKL